jgi:hypothetical protein
MNLTEQIKQDGLVKTVVNGGGSLHPLIIPESETNGTGLMNPSILVDGDDLIVNIRHVNYTLYHSEGRKHLHRYGPLQYLHAENDRNLRTWNYFCTLNKDLTIKTINKVDTTKLDVAPLWNFIGLEDCRVVRWNGKLYLSGVRRDTTTNGQGRIELSELEVSDTEVKEVRRTRLPAPRDDKTYCEKNWMPIADQPFAYIKWSNPTERVVCDIDAVTTTTTHLNEARYVVGLKDFRGGSHVIPYGDYHIAFSHDVDLTKPPVGSKDAIYRHRIIVWDKNWNLVKFTEPFDFMDAKIEFCCGAAFYGDSLLVTFGYQDNCSFILKMPTSMLAELLGV